MAKKKNPDVPFPSLLKRALYESHQRFQNEVQRLVAMAAEDLGLSVGEWVADFQNEVFKHK